LLPQSLGDPPPAYIQALNNLGNTLKYQGKMDEAIACFHQVLRIDPNYPEAYAALSHCQQISSDDTQGMTEQLHRTDLPIKDQIPLQFALGAIYDKSGQYEAAFARTEQANQLHKAELERSSHAFDYQTLIKRVDTLIENFPKDIFSSELRGSSSSLPVFIVGMPRSGTTLVEQIIASHPQVFGAGELEDMEQLTKRLSKECRNIPYPDCMAQINKATLGKLAAWYLDNLKRRSPDALRITDKMPDNIFHLGLITLLFPNAHIIVCQRDPRDICLSCFFQKFTHSHNYSTDLADCGRRYLQTMRLLDHWKKVLPKPVLEIHYEKLVNDLEGETRRLLEFLVLEWSPQCLEFHNTHRDVKTASHWQVRQPLYTSSVGRWRHYEKHLQSMLDVLQSEATL
jgi:tetratricopeptide (TPR) repeat protein